MWGVLIYSLGTVYFVWESLEMLCRSLGWPALPLAAQFWGVGAGVSGFGGGVSVMFWNQSAWNIVGSLQTSGVYFCSNNSDTEFCPSVGKSLSET